MALLNELCSAPKRSKKVPILANRKLLLVFRLEHGISARPCVSFIFDSAVGSEHNLFLTSKLFDVAIAVISS